MKIYVGQHELKIIKDDVNEKEINITLCEFEFDEAITNDFVKDVYFTYKGTTYQIANMQNNQCYIPIEVLNKNGLVELGVVAYLIENGEYVKRYNPTSVFFPSKRGSLKDKYENSEQITPTDKEQIEQMLSNINLSITKEGKIATITFTNQDGTIQTETLEDGKSIEYNWEGTSLGIRQEGEIDYQYVNLKGEKGEAGAIKMIIVNELPTENIDTSAIYLVPLEITESQENKYAEYVYINNEWELLGEIGVEVDLTDYVKNTDYANSNVGGVIKPSAIYNTVVSSNYGILYCDINNYTDYQTKSNNAFISKGTLENVITGKGLVSNTDYASSSKGGVVKVNSTFNTSLSEFGTLYCLVLSYANYQNSGTTSFISKGTLENVLNEKIGTIEIILTTLTTGSGV